MKIFPVKGYTSKSTTAFQGHTKYFGVDRYGDVELKLYKTSIPNLSQDESELVLSYAYPNSTVEKTLDTFHSKPTGAVYYADPLESISDKLREQVDYVVYDNEPEYPKVNGEVSENYFGTKRINYGKKYGEIRDYYYRLEMADAREAEKYKRNILAGIDVENSKEKMDYYNDRIAKSKYQQWQAAECINIYEKGNSLRAKKESLEDSIRYFENEIQRNEEELPKKKAALKEASEKSAEEQAVYDLLELKRKYVNKAVALNKRLAEKNPASQAVYQEELENINNMLYALKNDEGKQRVAILSLKEKIENCKKFISSFPRRIATLRKKIKANETQIEEVKAKLIPIFDELKNFYAKQKILH